MTTNKEMVKVLLNARKDIKEIYESNINDVSQNSELSDEIKKYVLQKLNEEHERVTAEINSRIQKVMGEWIERDWA